MMMIRNYFASFYIKNISENSFREDTIDSNNTSIFSFTW